MLNRFKTKCADKVAKWCKKRKQNAEQCCDIKAPENKVYVQGQCVQLMNILNVILKILDF